MPSRKNLTAAIVVPLIIGIIGFVNLMHQERFASYRTVDVLQLTGSGMCFGVALVAFVALMRGPRVP
jgi:hypothetical protein